jgi:hypothetical protein
MSVSSGTIRRLAALNLAPEAMSEVLSIIADLAGKGDERRAKDRARKRRSMESPRKTDGSSMETVAEPDQKESPPNPQKKEPPLEGTPPAGATPLCPPQKSHRGGQRLPEDWQPSFDPVAFAVSDAERRDKRPLTEVEVVDQIERMRNWARQVSDSKGRKKDWDAALRNWLKEATDRKNDRQPKPAYGNRDKHDVSAGFDFLEEQIAGRGYGR